MMSAFSYSAWSKSVNTKNHKVSGWTTVDVDMSQQFKLNSHALIEISPTDWNILLQLYSEKKSEPNGYSVIFHYIELIKKCPNMDVKILSVDGEWENDGTFIIIADNGRKLKTVYFNTLSTDLDRLTNAIFCLTSSTEEYNLCGYGERLELAADVYIRHFDTAKRYSIAASWYKVRKELVATFSINLPSGFTLRQLNTEDAFIINELWSYSSVSSVEYVKKLILHNISVGAWDAKGNLIAWCLRHSNGLLGLLHVLESYRRQGLACVLVQYMSKKICEINEEALTSVEPENTASTKMFEKLGFKKINAAFWNFARSE